MNPGVSDYQYNNTPDSLSQSVKGGLGNDNKKPMSKPAPPNKKAAQKKIIKSKVISSTQDLLNLVNSKSVEAVEWGGQLNHDSCHEENLRIFKKNPLLSTEILGALSLAILNLAKGLSQVSKENRRKPKHTQRKKPRGEKGKKSCKERSRE